MIGLLVLVAMWLLELRFLPVAGGNGEVQQAWIPLAIGAGLSLVNMLASRKGDKAASRASAAANLRMEQATEEEAGFRRQREGEAATTRQGYIDRLSGFDPAAYTQQAAGALREDFQETAGMQEAERRQATTGRGFLSSPLGAGRQMRDLNTRLARSLSSMAFEQAGLEERRIGAFGDVSRQDASRADVSRERELELGAGQRDAAIARENDRTKRRTGFLGSVAQGIGAYYGAR